MTSWGLFEEDTTMKKHWILPLAATLLLSFACKKAPADAPASEAAAESEEKSGSRMMTGTPAPNLAPGETRAFGNAIEADAAKVSVPTLLSDCLDTDELCTVEGQIGAACRSSGCWFTLTGPDVTELILVEMEDEAFTIPKNAAGTDAVLRGKLTRTNFSQTEAFYYESEAARSLGRNAPKKEDAQTEGYLFTIDAAEMTKGSEG